MYVSTYLENKCTFFTPSHIKALCIKMLEIFGILHMAPLGVETTYISLKIKEWLTKLTEYKSCTLSLRYPSTWDMLSESSDILFSACWNVLRNSTANWLTDDLKDVGSCNLLDQWSPRGTSEKSLKVLKVCRYIHIT